MTFDQNYYNQKKEKINLKIVKAKNEVIVDLINRLNRFLSEQKELSDDLAEILKIEKENQEQKKEEIKEAPKP